VSPAKGRILSLFCFFQHASPTKRRLQLLFLLSSLHHHHQPQTTQTQLFQKKKKNIISSKMAEKSFSSSPGEEKTTSFLFQGYKVTLTIPSGEDVLGIKMTTSDLSMTSRTFHCDIVGSKVAREKYRCNIETLFEFIVAAGTVCPRHIIIFFLFSLFLLSSIIFGLFLSFFHVFAFISCFIMCSLLFVLFSSF